MSSVVKREIVRRVEELFGLADQFEERLARARGQVDALTTSLFAGPLVAQEPTDEPAETLLERIKQNRSEIASGLRLEKRSRATQVASTPG